VQEDIEHRTVSLTISAVKFTGRVLKEAITRYLQHSQKHKQGKSTTKSGRVTMRQLQKQYGELRSVTVDDNNTRQFERIARKYHVQYKVFKCEKGKYQIFFKAPNAAAMESAFMEFSTQKLERADRPSIVQRLQRAIEHVPVIGNKVRQKEPDR